MRPQKVKNLTNLKTAVTIPIKIPIEELVKKFLKSVVIHQFYVVDENNKLLGIINRKQLFRKIYHHRLQPSTRISLLYQLAVAKNVEGMLITHFLAAKPDDDLDDVIKTMLENDIYEIPVVDAAGCLLGKLDTIYFLESWLEKQPEK